jgi:hypothetical protein
MSGQHYQRMMMRPKITHATDNSTPILIVPSIASEYIPSGREFPDGHPLVIEYRNGKYDIYRTVGVKFERVLLTAISICASLSILLA